MIRSNLWGYDAFVSYAKADSLGRRFRQEMVARLQDAYRVETGKDLRLFIDEDSMANAVLWKQRIDRALRSSATFVAVITPAYFASKWCAREWDMFLTLEDVRRDKLNLRDDKSFIFPVLLKEISGPTSPEVARRLEEINARQYTDLVDLQPEDPQYSRRISRLVGDVVIALKKASDAMAVGSDTSVAPIEESDLIPQILRTALYSGIREHGILNRLAIARSATIVGTTNEWVPDCVERALALKRQREGALAFWDQLHIVFLSNVLLPRVSDDLEIDFPAPIEAARQRIARADQARRSLMSLLLREGVSGKWKLCNHPLQLPFVGSLCTLRDGKSIAQLTFGGRPDQQNFCIDVLDGATSHFERAFREVVEVSDEDHEIVLVGNPGKEGTFTCRETRFRRSVLEGGHNSTDWLAAVVVLTWRQGVHGPEPLIQVNTPKNSTREIGKASHVSGYMNERDCLRTDENHNSNSSSFDVSISTARRTAVRELLDVGLTEVKSEPHFIDTIPFIYCGKENLFFYLFSFQVPNGFVFRESVHMLGWRLDELMKVRQNQVYVNALKSLESEMSREERQRALRIVMHNLILHRDDQLAADIAGIAQRGRASKSVLSRLRKAVEANAVHKYLSGKRVHVDGIAGLQYRAFFSHLLPAYERFGVENATELMALIRNDSKRCESIRVLQELYTDERFMESIPVEV